MSFSKVIGRLFYYYFFFSKHVVIMESNEAEVLAILETLRLYGPISHLKLIVQRNFSDCFSTSSSWQFRFFFNKIKYVSSLFRVEFKLIGQSANYSANYLTKQGVDKSSPLAIGSM